MKPLKESNVTLCNNQGVNDEAFLLYEKMGIINFPIHSAL